MAPPAQEDPSLLTDLSAHALQTACAFLPARDAARAACVCRALRVASAGEAAWEARCRADLALDDPTDTGCEAAVGAGEWRRAYAAVANEAHLRSGGLDAAARARRAVAGLRAWCAEHAPAIGASLRRGATQVQVEAFEREHYVLPPGVAHLYRACDGQELTFDTDFLDRQLAEDERERGEEEADAGPPGGTPAAPDGSLFHGLFGSYVVYDHVVSVRWLPLRRARRITRMLRMHAALPEARAPGPTWRDEHVMFASFRLDKRFVVGHDGALRVNNRLGEYMHAAPPPAGGAAGRSSLPVLGWLEDYARAVADLGNFAARTLGEEAVGPLRGGEPTCISLFPTGGQATSDATTDGVRVRCAALFLPEHSDPQGGAYVFAYNIRFSRVPTAPDTAQLRSRRWLFWDANGDKQEAQGPGVIGMYPLLRPGDEPVDYCSQCRLRTPSGTMEGGFEFVRGSNDAPLGAPFEATCARAQLAVPAYIF